MQGSTINQREKICSLCPIFNPYTKECNPKLWLNPDTNEVSTTAKHGFIRGCGCKLVFKWRNINSHCIAGKW